MAPRTYEVHTCQWVFTVQRRMTITFFKNVKTTMTSHDRELTGRKKKVLHLGPLTTVLSPGFEEETPHFPFAPSPVNEVVSSAHRIVRNNKRFVL